MEKGDPLTLLVGIYKLGQPLWKTVWKVLKKLKIELPYNPTIALLGIYPKITKISNSRGYMHPDIYSSIIYNSQIMERAQMCINSGMDEEIVVCIYMHTYYLFIS